MHANQDNTSTSNPLPPREEVTCLTVGAATEVAVVADLRQELVDMEPVISYATRLRILLRTLHAINMNRVDRGEQVIFPGVVEKLRTIHHVQWTITDQEQKMSLVAVFDTPLELYIRRLVDEALPVLNVILCHCEGYEGHLGYAAFADFLRRNQVAQEFFGSGVHGLTVEDKAFLKRLEKDQRDDNHESWDSFDQHAATLRAPPATPELSPEDMEEGARQATRLLAALHRLDRFFPGTSEQSNREQGFFHAMVRSFLPGFSRDWIPAESDLARRYQRELDWLDHLREGESPGDSTPAEESSAPGEAILSEVQGDILQHYKGIGAGCLLLLQLGEPSRARNVLELIRPLVTTVNREGTIQGEMGPAVALNLALTARGLKTLGLGDEDMARFPIEFRAGMRARASQLGDVGSNHPGNWELPRENWETSGDHGFTLDAVDAVVQMQFRTTDATETDFSGDSFPGSSLHAEVDNLAREISAAGGRILRVEPMFRRRNEEGRVVGHFGFADGISQPTVWSMPSDRDWVPTGELLLGHKNRHGECTVQDSDELLYNGSFLVLRKLAQDVEAFETFTGGAGNDPEGDIFLKSRMLGRMPNGEPLTEAPPPSPNDFDFRGDPHGLHCPLESHIRRANPRAGESRTIPRIARRGFSYEHATTGSGKRGERGLFFMAYNASIAEQYEIIQHWINGGNSTERPSSQGDPLLGPRQDGTSRTLRIPQSDEAPRRYELPKAPFVAPRWGLYLFCPSLAALDNLIQRKNRRVSYPAPDVERGARFLAQFELAADNDPLRDKNKEAWLAKWRTRWKILLEDPSTRKYREDVWAAIRLQRGLKKTVVGVLVATQQRLGEILRDRGRNYSVREYGERMDATLGRTYLGMDPEPADRQESPYDDLAGPVNEWLSDFGREKAYRETLEVTNEELEKRLIPEGDQTVYGAIDTDEVARDVFGRLAASWFGIPDSAAIDIGGTPGDKPHCPEDFVLAAQYIFPPHYSDFLDGKARGRCPVLRQRIGEAIDTPPGTAAPAGDHLLGYLRQLDWDLNTISNTVTGAAMGFLAPTTGSLLSVLRTWINSGDLWRHQVSLRAAVGTPRESFDQVEDTLLGALIRAMQEDPHPPCLHRTVARDLEIGDVSLKQGDQLILGMASGTLEQLEDPEDVSQASRLNSLFGGDPEPGSPGKATHACPGRDMALGTMLGFCTAILLQPGTLRSSGGLQLTLNEPPR